MKKKNSRRGRVTKSSRDAKVSADYGVMASPSVVVAHGYIQAIHWNLATIVYDIANEDAFDISYDGDGECFDPLPEGAAGIELDEEIALRNRPDSSAAFIEQRMLSADEYSEIRDRPSFFVLSDPDTGKSRYKWVTCD